MSDETLKKEGFSKFWTKDKTQALLDILESENSKGDIKYGKVAELLSDHLHLDKKLNAEQISSRIAILSSSYKRESDREARSGIQSTWRWKSQLSKINFQKVSAPGITLYKSKDADDLLDLRPGSFESLSAPMRTVERPGLITTLKSNSNTTLASNENDETESENEEEQEMSKTPDRKIEPKDETDSPLAERAGLLTGERRGRMPDQHILRTIKEILLDCYKFVLQNRMLSSGRLGKGSFQEVTDEMNKRCNMQENNFYEREQLAAKLQNLKTQFRNRKIAVDEGKENKNTWKWYSIMDDLSHAEGLLRESFDATTRVNVSYGTAEDESQPSHSLDGRTREGKRLAHLNEKHLPEKKRILSNNEIESSIGNLSMLLTNKTESRSKANIDKMDDIRSMAFQLFTGVSSIIDYINRPDGT